MVQSKKEEAKRNGYFTMSRMVAFRKSGGGGEGSQSEHTFLMESCHSYKI